MERCPSWPKEHDWKSCRRHKRLEGSNPSLSAIINLYTLLHGPLVKGLRHLPFTEVTGVRIPYGSPSLLMLPKYGGLAQLGEHLPYKQRVSGSIPLASTIQLTRGGAVR